MYTLGTSLVLRDGGTTWVPPRVVREGVLPGYLPGYQSAYYLVGAQVTPSAYYLVGTQVTHPVLPGYLQPGTPIPYYLGTSSQTPSAYYLGTEA